MYRGSDNHVWKPVNKVLSGVIIFLTKHPYNLTELRDKRTSCYEYIYVILK